MNLFKKLFSERMFRFIVGICICIISVIITLSLIVAIIEAVIPTSDENGTIRRLEVLGHELSEFSADKENVAFYADTINGNMFQFKDLLVIPWVEMKSDSLGNKNTILNFKVYNMSTKKEFNLFPENQRISNSKLIQIKEHLIWFIEAEDSFFIYDNQSTDLVKASFPIGYSFIYPELFNIEGIEELSNEKERPTKTKVPDTYLVNKNVSSFSIIGNQLLLCAQKEKDKQYWFYDLETKEIWKLN